MYRGSVLTVAAPGFKSWPGALCCVSPGNLVQLNKCVCNVYNIINNYEKLRLLLTLLKRHYAILEKGVKFRI